MGYGTGAIMAVPGQDTRDWDFATAFGLPIIRTVQPPADHPDDEAFTGDGPAINSANDEISLDGLGVAEAKIDDHRLAAAARVSAARRSSTSCGTGCSPGSGTGASRSRSSTTTTASRIALPDDQLPLTLPEVDDYSPQSFDPQDATSEPVPPLARATEWATSRWIWATARRPTGAS